MPWQNEDAARFTKKAKSKKRRRQWRIVANAQLRRGLSEGAAVRSANAAVAKATGQKS